MRFGGINSSSTSAVAGFADGEKPTGAVSGLNTNYTLAQTPIAGTLHVYIAGLRIDPANFSLTGAVLTIVTALVTGLVLVDYRYAL